MWIFELLKAAWASYRASRAAKAAADLPAGQVAVDSIKADGDTIRAELANGTAK